jgi:hypothetical protein
MTHCQRRGRLPATQTHPLDLFYLFCHTDYVSYNTNNPLAHRAPPMQANPHVQRLISTTTLQNQDARICTIMRDHSRVSFVSVSSLCFVDLRSQEYTQESTHQPEARIH